MESREPVQLELPLPLPPPPALSLDELLKRSAEWYRTATPEQREAMHAVQRASFVRGEMSWPRDCPYR